MARHREGETLDEAPQPLAGSGAPGITEPGQTAADADLAQLAEAGVEPDRGIASRTVTLAPVDVVDDMAAPPLRDDLLADQSNGAHAGYVVDPDDYSPVKDADTGRGVNFDRLVDQAAEAAAAAGEEG